MSECVTTLARIRPFNAKEKANNELSILAMTDKNKIVYNN